MRFRRKAFGYASEISLEISELCNTCARVIGYEACGRWGAKETPMASTLIGGRGRDRLTDKGHGTEALGPSDTTDSGSDITGGPGTVEGDVIGLDRGTNEDADVRGPFPTAGPDIGDAELDSDSDSVGTGEHLTAGREPQTRADNDIRPDHVERIVDLPLDELEEGPGERAR
jgi:hypothetical protein